MEVTMGQTYNILEVEDLDYGCITGDGSFNVLYGLKLMELVRFFGPVPAKENRLNQAYFLAWQQFEIFPHLHAIGKHFRPVFSSKFLEGLRRKVKAFHRLHPVGNTSQKFEDVVYDETTDKLMMNAVARVVKVDIETKRPTPYSQIMKDHYRQNQDGDFIKIHRRFGDKCTKLYQIPENVATFCRTTQITASHVDNNNHVNHIAYVSLSLDCLAQGLLSGFGWKSPISNREIERISCLYLKECVLGDVVDAIVWQNPSDPSVFHFHIKKKTDVVCQLEFQFFAISSKL